MNARHITADKYWNRVGSNADLSRALKLCRSGGFPVERDHAAGTVIARTPCILDLASAPPLPAGSPVLKAIQIAPAAWFISYRKGVFGEPR